MGAQMNIKDARTVELARDLAKQLGKTMTDVVREALEEKKRRREEDIERAVRDVMGMVEALQEHWDPETKRMTSKEMMDAIYDENGLPV
jgi:antitoxin VapB